MNQCPSQTLRIAVLQEAPCHDTKAALNRLDRAAAEAGQGGSELLITPEMWLGGYNIGADAVTTLAARADVLADAVAAIARRHGVAILTGMAMAGPARPFNGALLVAGDGTPLVQYHKTHLFGDVDRDQFAAGDRLSPIVLLNGWCIGIAICFDIEFPETARALALAGADLIAVPTANMAPFDSIATRIAPARAEENALFVAYANYCGTEGAFDYCGLSCICGPDGEDLARAGRGPALIRATLDPGAMVARRGALDYLRQRRTDIY